MREVYYKAIAAISPAVLGLFRLWSRFVSTPRVRVVLLSEDDEVLLVINALSDQRWTLPGGGVERGEQPVHAAVREVEEELHITLAGSELIACGQFDTPHYSAPIFCARISKSDFISDNRSKAEIRSTRWVTQQKLPQHCEPVVSAALELLSRAANIGKISRAIR